MNRTEIMKRLFPIVILMGLIIIPLIGKDFTYSMGTLSGISQGQLKSHVVSDYLLGSFASREDDLDQAITYYSSALKKSPGNTGLIKKLIHLKLKTGAIKDAIKLAKQFVKHEPHSLLANTLITVDAAKHKDYLKAQDILMRISASSDEKENGIITTYLLAYMDIWLLVGLGEHQKAIDLQKAILDNIHSFFKSPLIQYYYKGILFDFAGRSSEAKEAFDQSSEMLFDPDLITPPFRYIRTMGHFYKQRGETAKALEIYKLYQEKQNMAPSFVEAFNKSNTKKPINNAVDGMVEILVDIATLYFQNYLYDEALPYLHIANYLHPNDGHLHFLIALQFEHLDHFERAIEYYKKIEKTDLFYLDSQLQIAYNYNLNGDLEKAKKLLYKISEDYPDRHEALITLADILHNKKKYDEAEVLYTKALERIGTPTKRHWPIFYARAIGYERVNLWEKAEADFLRALELHPNQPDVLNYLGYSWITRGENIERAKAMIDISVRKRPYDAHIIDSLGWSHYALGEYEQAVEHLEKALSMTPSDPVVNDHLGDAYWQTGRKLEAVFQWNHALTFDPDPEEAEKIKEKIKNGLDSAEIVKD